MRIGFTGTRRGMSTLQAFQLRAQLIKLGATEFHHGDCLGADSDAHAVAKELGILIYIHPPSDSKLRAYNKGFKHYFPLPYLECNHAIVDTTELLIAAPSSMTAERRSGTWATVRYAIKQNKPIHLLEVK